MLVVAGQRYGTSPVQLRKLFKDDEDSALLNDPYFDQMFELENSAVDLTVPVDDDAEDADDEEDAEYEVEGEADDYDEEVNDDDDDDDDYDDDQTTEPLEYFDYG